MTTRHVSRGDSSFRNLRYRKTRRWGSPYTSWRRTIKTQGPMEKLPTNWTKGYPMTFHLIWTRKPVSLLYPRGWITKQLSRTGMLAWLFCNIICDLNNNSLKLRLGPLCDLRQRCLFICRGKFKFANKNKNINEVFFKMPISTLNHVLENNYVIKKIICTRFLRKLVNHVIAFVFLSVSVSKL